MDQFSGEQQTGKDEDGLEVAAPAVPGYGPPITPSQQLTGDYCNVGVQALFTMLRSPNDTANETSTTTVPSQDGCELTLIGYQGTQGTGPRLALGTYLWHYGVLLAADATAHKQQPQLPLALPGDIATLAP